MAILRTHEGQISEPYDRTRIGDTEEIEPRLVHQYQAAAGVYLMDAHRCAVKQYPELIDLAKRPISRVSSIMISPRISPMPLTVSNSFPSQRASKSSSDKRHTGIRIPRYKP